MKPAAILFSSLVLSLASVHAAGDVLEIRLVKLTGTEPSDKTLQALVEDACAQATAMVTVPLASAGDTEIKQLSPYRYPTEFTAKGDPDTFDTRNLGWEGKASIISTDQKGMSLVLDISNHRAGTPHVHDTEGVQTYMPTFTTIEMIIGGMPLTRGAWKFVKTPDKESTFLAVRVAGAAS
ncbi:MAG: hypothetical protein EOP88_05890 [Verrucomicrobiaceae bacterium]|nr:MAG: hypothetical protein EOP88_05890 [Verrucomicrobiaceae bacterium]